MTSLMKKGLRPVVVDVVTKLNGLHDFPDEEGIKTASRLRACASHGLHDFPDEEGIKTLLALVIATIIVPA